MIITAQSPSSVNDGWISEKQKTRDRKQKLESRNPKFEIRNSRFDNAEGEKGTWRRAEAGWGAKNGSHGSTIPRSHHKGHSGTDPRTIRNMYPTCTPYTAMIPLEGPPGD